MVEETNQPESSPPQDVATAIPSGAVEDQQAEPHAPENPSADGQIQTESAPPKKPTVPVDVLFNRAVDSNDIAGARAAIARGASVRAYNTFNQTALHNAAAHGHVEMVHFLLRNGADIEALGARRETALHHAALQGHLGVVEILLRAEANVKALDSYKRTPAHAACGGSLKNQISEVMRLLFEKLGSTDDINKHVDALRPGSKTSCLHMLSENGRNDDIIWLLGLGADCNWRDSNGRTAWETASYEDWKSVAAFVLKESSLAVTLNGVEPMTWWKHEFDIKEEKFVEYSFDVNCVSGSIETCLQQLTIYSEVHYT
jgi:ankyrin repeat protein